MVPSPESWRGPRLEGGLRRGAAAAALGMVLFAGSVALIHATPLGRHQIVDTAVYQRYGDAVLAGRVPYRDFELEYPPGALAAFLLPSLGPAAHYRTAFEVLVVLFGLGLVAAVAAALVAVGASLERLLLGCALAGLAPLALGSVVLTRYDGWPAMLAAGALAALVAGRERTGLAVLGLAVAAKVWPAVLLPLALVYVGRRSGGRAALAALAAFVLVLGAVLLPFGILAPDGLAESLSRQTERPLQVESLGSSLLLAAHQAGAYEPTVVSSFGSQNLTGALPDALATLQTVLQAVAVAAVWLLFLTRRGRSDELLAASAAAVACFVAFGKVLSPQFLVWLVPLVPLVLGPLGSAAAGLFLLALVLTQLWFPQRYWELVAFEAGPAWLLLARNAVLLALAAVLAAAIRPVPGRLRSS